MMLLNHLATMRFAASIPAWHMDHHVNAEGAGGAPDAGIWSARVGHLVHHAAHFETMTGAVKMDMAKVRQRKRDMVFDRQGRRRPCDLGARRFEPSHRISHGKFGRGSGCRAGRCRGDIGDVEAASPNNGCGLHLQAGYQVQRYRRCL